MLRHIPHVTRKSLLRQVPRMAGRELDLHQLYRNVSALGGCLRVTAEKKWRVRRPGRRSPPPPLARGALAALPAAQLRPKLPGFVL
jgi:hypothetical protein